MKNSILWISSFIAVTLIYHFSYGLETLLPTNISWLMTVKHDWGTHYLGWHFFKNEPWHFPLGQVNNYFYPLGTNVGFTDSIPLLAFFFKLFGHWLPEDFQYFGIWLYACHLLAAYYTILILKLFKVKPILILCAVVIIAGNPVLIYRGLHPALCAQWLLLACVYLYFLSPSEVGVKKILGYQFIVLLLSALINPYLCFMVLGFTFITATKIAFFDKQINWKYFGGYLVGSIFGLLLVWFLAGLLTFGAKEDLAVQGGYGLYSLNLNALYDPQGFSRYLPTQKRVSLHQYEGFMYLGLGMILLLGLLLIYAIVQLFVGKYKMRLVNLSVGSNRVSLVPLLILVFLYTIFSITHIISINDHILLKIPIPSLLNKLGEVFRASARFFWLTYYLILLGAIIALARVRINPFIKTALLVALTVLQLVDTKLVFTFRRLTFGSYQIPLDKHWDSLIRRFDVITFYPPFQTNQLTDMDYQYFCYKAAVARKPINIGYVARIDNKAMIAYNDSLESALAEGRIAANTIYISTPQHISKLSMPLQTGAASLNILDGYYYLLSDSLREDPIFKSSVALNMRDQKKLDSVSNKLGKKLFTETSPFKISKGESVRFGIDKIMDQEQFLSVRGFAFIENSRSDKGDSVFITLQSDQRWYIAPTFVELRPDVTSFFKLPYLDEAGFNSVTFKSDVKRGVYRLGLVVKAANGHTVYQPTNESVKIGMEEYPTPEKISLLPSVDNMNASVEGILENPTYWLIKGWAFLPGQDSEGSEITLVLNRDGQNVAVNTNPVMRPDVTTYFKSKNNLEYSGFEVKLLKSKLAKGKYRIGILVKNKRNNSESFKLTDKTVEIL